MLFVELAWLAVLPFLLALPWLARRRTTLEAAALTPNHAASWSTYEEHLKDQLEWLNYTWATAHQALARENHDSATRFIEATEILVRALAESLSKDLAVWRTHAAPLTRALPPEPVPWRSLRLRRLRLAALGVTVVHALLVTLAERLRWQMRALRWSLRRLVTAWPRSPRSQDAYTWQRVEDLLTDLHTLAHATLDTYHLLLFAVQLALDEEDEH